MQRCLVLVIALVGCNPPEKMTHYDVPQTFMGTIPNDFKNTADAASFQAAAAQLAGQLGTTAGALTLTSNEGLPLAPAQPAGDGLVELDGCSNLAAISGGFTLRSSVDHAAAPDLADLAGETCDAALTGAGVTFTGLVRALQAQSGNLGRLALASDACTAIRQNPRQPQWAALGYWFAPDSQLMSDSVWHVPTALFEGGTDGHHLALRSEVDTDATTTESDGSVLRTAQWAGVGAFADLASGTITAEKAEVLDIRSDKGDQRTRDDAFTRDANVTIKVGSAATVDESTTYRLYKGEAPEQIWMVTLHAEPADAGAMNVDLTLMQQYATLPTVKLRLGPDANGVCMASAR